MATTIYEPLLPVPGFDIRDFRRLPGEPVAVETHGGRTIVRVRPEALRVHRAGDAIRPHAGVEPIAFPELLPGHDVHLRDRHIADRADRRVLHRRRQRIDRDVTQRGQGHGADDCLCTVARAILAGHLRAVGPRLDRDDAPFLQQIALQVTRHGFRQSLVAALECADEGRTTRSAVDDLPLRDSRLHQQRHVMRGGAVRNVAVVGELDRRIAGPVRREELVHGNIVLRELRIEPAAEFLERHVALEQCLGETPRG